MDPDRLTGFVYPVKKNGVPVRGRWQLWVNLPSEPAFDRDGQPVLDAKGRQRQRYPKTTKVVAAQGKKAAERLLETWIAGLAEAHREAIEKLEAQRELWSARQQLKRTRDREGGERGGRDPRTAPG